MSFLDLPLSVLKIASRLESEPTVLRSPGSVENSALLDGRGEIWLGRSCWSLLEECDEADVVGRFGGAALERPKNPFLSRTGGAFEGLGAVRV